MSTGQKDRSKQVELWPVVALKSHQANRRQLVLERVQPQLEPVLAQQELMFEHLQLIKI